jgi:hypothetical protein
MEMGNFRVELPILGERGRFANFETREFAVAAARKMAQELKVLALVWDFGAVMYTDRIDGRVAA